MRIQEGRSRGNSMQSRHLVLAAVLASALAQAAEQPACTTRDLQSKAPSGTTISDASVVAATEKLPEYCLVKGSVATEGNHVDFQLGLPAKWNGKFLFQGVGGFAGAMGRLDAGLTRGYAPATTDTGHQ